MLAGASKGQSSVSHLILQGYKWNPFIISYYNHSKFLGENQAPLADLAIPDISPDNCVNPQIMVLAITSLSGSLCRAGQEQDLMWGGF